MKCVFLSALLLICANSILTTLESDFSDGNEWNSIPPTKVIVKDCSGKDVSKVVLNKYHYFKTD